MARAKKKPAAKPKGKTKPTRKAPASTRRKGPRSQTLPGMDQVRNRKLDNLCEAIGEERNRMNAAKQEEQASIQAALQVMQRDNVTVYKHAGVELARVPGAEKLRVRLVKEQGDADAGDLETGETDNDQVGDERRSAVEDLGGEGGES